MKYINTFCCQYKTAKKIYDEMVSENIGKVDKIWQDDEHYIVSWMPYGKSNYNKGVQIIDKYIWDDAKLFEDFDESKLSADTLEAIDEAKDIIAHPEKYKGYHSVKEMFADLGIKL